VEVVVGPGRVDVATGTELVVLGNDVDVTDEDEVVVLLLACDVVVDR
jgi:hypothetical protein